MSLSDSENDQYIFQQGDSLDTLWDLADQNGMQVEDIFTANPGVDFNNLVVGQAISIPDPPSTPQPTSRPSEHYRRSEYRNRSNRGNYYQHPYPYRPYYPYGTPGVRCPNPYYIQPGDSLYNIVSPVAES